MACLFFTLFGAVLKQQKVDLDASDGFGMMLPSLAERWSKELYHRSSENQFYITHIEIISPRIFDNVFSSGNLFCKIYIIKCESHSFFK